MTRFNTTLPPPILGVVTGHGVAKIPGAASEQVNFRSNQKHRLSRRKRAEWIQVLLANSVDVLHHHIRREGIEYHAILEANGTISIYAGTAMTVNTVPAGYMGDLTSMQFEQINDTLLLLNTDKIVRMDNTIVGVYNQPTHINVITALAYETTLVLIAKRVTEAGETVAEVKVSHTVAGVNFTDGDYSAADASRSTNVVAEDIWRQLNNISYGGIFRFFAAARANLIAMQETIAWMGPHMEGGPTWTAEAARIGGMFAALDALQTDIVQDMGAANGAYLSTAYHILDMAQAEEDTAADNCITSMQLIQDLAIEIDPTVYATWLTSTNNVGYTNALFLIPPYNTAPEIVILNGLIADHVANIGILVTKTAAVVAAQAVVDNNAINPVAYTAAWNRLPELFTAWRAALNSAGTAVYHPYHTPMAVNPARDGGLAAIATAEAEFLLGEQAYAAIINTGTFRAELLGNNVDVYATGYHTTDTVVITVEKGMGDKNIKIISPHVGNTESMPLYAIPYSLVEVIPDPANPHNGNYYLQATPIKLVNNVGMTEVIWTETVNPRIKNSLDPNTLPVSILLTPSVVFSWDETPLWRSRTRGDETSCPNPSFVNKTIQNISYFQKRLVFLSDNNVIMSETGDVWNFFKASALRLLVSDPIDIASTATGVDVLRWTVTHNRDLLVFARNAQFKISGNQPITPETVSMAMTTKFDSQNSVKPVSSGNLVYFAVGYGASAGVFEYTAQPNTSQDMSGDMSVLIDGYIPGRITKLAANANKGLVICTSSLAATNELFICEVTYVENNPWKSWSKWVLPVGDILNMYFEGNLLWVVQKTPEAVVLKGIRLEKDITKGFDELCLDDLIQIPAAGGTGTPEWLLKSTVEDTIAAAVSGTGDVVVTIANDILGGVYLSTNGDATRNLVWDASTLGGIDSAAVNEEGTMLVAKAYGTYDYPTGYLYTISSGLWTAITQPAFPGISAIFWKGAEIWVVKQHSPFGIYKSTNLGATWTLVTPNNGHVWGILTRSQTSGTLILEETIPFDSPLRWISYDNGVTLTAFTYFGHVYLQPDGLKLYSKIDTALNVSTNFGTTWTTLLTAPNTIRTVKTSYDGTYLVYGAGTDSISQTVYASRDGGATIELTSAYMGYVSSLDVSTDGTYAIAGIYGETGIGYYTSLLWSDITAIHTVPNVWGPIDEGCVLINAATMTRVDLPIVNRAVTSDLDLWVGRRYESSYMPVKFWLRDGKGNSKVFEHVRINRVTASVKNSYKLKMDKYREGVLLRTEAFATTFDYEDAALFHNMYTGQVDFYWKDKAENSNVRFWTRAYLQCEISLFSLRGQYHQPAGDL